MARVSAPLLISHKVKDILKFVSKMRKRFLDMHDKNDNETNRVSYKTAKRKAEQEAKKS